MIKVPTAEEFIEQYATWTVRDSPDTMTTVIDKADCLEAMKEFAKLHVKAALKAAHDNVKMSVQPYDMEAWEVVPDTIRAEDLEEHEDGFEIEIDKESILNAYPENLIQ